MKILTALALLLSALSLPAQQVSTGLYHSFATCADGSVKAFGRNDYGQLGAGNTNQQNSPVTVSGLPPISKAVASKGYFSVFLAENGQVWMAGNNGYGNFGTNSISSTNSSPVQAPVSGIVDVAAGFGHSVLLDASGAVWTSGWGNQGQLGTGSFNNALVFTQVAGLPTIVQVEAGYWHTILLADDGTVWAMGSNNLGQIGLSSGVPYSNTPIQIPGLSGIEEISAGSYYSLFLDSNHAVHACGSNPNGQLAQGDFLNQFGVSPCIGLPPIAHIEAGNEHSLFLDFNAHVWGVGLANFGQNGVGATTATPALIDELQEVISIAAGGDGNAGTSLFLKASGAMWGCGSGGSGQLGVPNVPFYAVPQFLSGVCGVNLPVAILEADEYLLCSELFNCFHLLDYSQNADQVTWYFGSGTPNEQNEFTVDVCFANPGTYEVYIEAVNDFGTDRDTVTLVLEAIPSITVPDQPDVFCLPEDEAPFPLTGFLPTGGIFAGPGVIMGAFHPAVAGIGTHTLTYSVETAPGCAASVDYELEVSDCQLPIVNLPGTSIQFCMSDTCVVIAGEANYADQLQWSIPGATGDSYLDVWEYTLCYPEPGTYAVSLTGTNSYGSTTATMEVEVLPNPEVSLELGDDLVCVGSDPVEVTLSGGLPEGGSYSGPGVFMDIFNADDSGLGAFAVTYSYTGDGCTSTATDSMYVQICSTVDEADHTSFRLSPNHGPGPYLLEISDARLAGGELVLYASSGAAVHRQQITSSVQLLSPSMELSEGIYLAVLRHGNVQAVARLVRMRE